MSTLAHSEVEVARLEGDNQDETRMRDASSGRRGARRSRAAQGTGALLAATTIRRTNSNLTCAF
jgi:hypothetical protein